MENKTRAIREETENISNMTKERRILNRAFHHDEVSTTLCLRAERKRIYVQIIYWLYTLSKCSWPIDGMQMYFEERNRRKAASGCERNREEREERRDRTCVKNVCNTYMYMYMYIRDARPEVRLLSWIEESRLPTL